MRLLLIGADFEENLGIGQVAAAAKLAGHAAQVSAFNDPQQIDEIAARALGARPDVIGLSMQFQHRGVDFVRLARRLRATGFEGHLTAGGQFATLAWRELLARGDFDSLVLFEGEETIVALLGALSEGRALDEVAGLALPAPSRRTAPRSIRHDLDALPTPLRYRPHARHFGVPFIPVMSSRGCWGRCTFCSITSFYREARAAGGGRTWRQRSPEHIADEMAALWRRVDGRAIYCFHDDTFLMPRPDDSIARVRAINAALAERGVGGPYAYVGKCRPDNLTPRLARQLSAEGVIRLYVGVENASRRGAAHLERARQTEHVSAALRACDEADIFVCYNLLIFEPEARLEDIEENLRFIRAHARHPINFCRAEPYSGTPLRASLEAPSGSFLGWNYRMEDDRAELLFRVTSAAFRQRNFDTDGVANRYMGLGYALKVVSTFYPDPDLRLPALRALVDEVTSGISLETADLLEEALRFVEGVALDDSERIARFTARLGLKIARLDGAQHRALDEAYAALNAFAEEGRRRWPRIKAQIKRWAQPIGLGAGIIGAMAACEDEMVSVDPVPEPMEAGPVDEGVEDIWMVDPLPMDAGREDMMVVDPPPWDAGREDVMVVDPPPPDAGRDVMVVDPLPEDAMVVDPLPPDVGFEDVLVVDPLPPDAGAEDVWVVDPPPPDAGTEDAWVVGDPLPPDAGAEDVMVVDPLPPDAGAEDVPLPVDPPPPDPSPSAQMIDQWRDSGSKGVRSADLPLFDPPKLALEATRRGELLEVWARVDGEHSARWESEAGSLEISGDRALWRPAHEDDQIRVAARTPGGVVIKARRARDFEA